MDRFPISQRTPEESGEPAWYCLRSQPKHEHIAAAHLRLLEEVTVFSPRIRFKRSTRRGVVWVTEGMFPGYLFAKFELAEMLRPVCYAHGVSGIVRFADRFPTIDEQTVERLMDQTDSGGVREMDYALSQGDDVRITDGVFAGLDAVVIEILPAKERVRILMDFLGRKIEAEVKHSSILRHAAHPLAA
jgi:transcriptional antiterminator RfaH